MSEVSPSLRDFLSLRYSATGHPLTRVFSQRIGAVLAWLASRIGLWPNHVTLLACALSVGGAWVFAVSQGTPAMVWSVLLLQLGYALDCADGQLARATRRTSPLGRWLDVFLDMLTITSLAFAALYRIECMEAALTGVATLATLAYCFARVGNLFTCTLARAAPAAGKDGPKSLARNLFLLTIDTPVVLACIPLLGNHPALLCAYLGAAAVPFTIHSLYVGIRSSRAASPQ